MASYERLDVTERAGQVMRACGRGQSPCRLCGGSLIYLLAERVQPIPAIEREEIEWLDVLYRLPDPR